MSHRLLLRVIAPPLNHAHLIDLLTASQGSGFIELQDATHRLNQAAMARAPKPLDTDVVVGGPLDGRPLASLSRRMQTMAVAPTIEVFPGDEAVIDEESCRLIGVPIFISMETRRVFVDAHRRLDIDTTELEAFFDAHHGLTGAICVE